MLLSEGSTRFICPLADPRLTSQEGFIFPGWVELAPPLQLLSGFLGYVWLTRLEGLW